MSEQDDDIQLSLTLPSTAAYVATARAFIAAAARHFGAEEEDVADLKVAVSEACSGAVRATDQFAEPFKIFVDAQLHELTVEILTPAKPPLAETAGPGTDLGLRSAIISQQRAAFMGYPIWGSDTGGYYQFKHREVFARWIEFSAFSGFMEIGGTGTHAPWDMPTEPAYDEEMIEIYRRYTKLRVTLQRYIVAAAAQAASGVPIVRPMPFLDRRDRRLADRWDQYMFGPDLLVAPVWRTGERSRAVYFPKGVWRSYWEPAQVFRGGRSATLPVPLDTILVFVRDGAEVPRP